MMGTLYDVETHTINYHLKKIFPDSELEEQVVIRYFRITAKDSKTYNTKHYNLSAIIAIGYKVNSERVDAVMRNLSFMEKWCDEAAALVASLNNATLPTP